MNSNSPAHNLIGRTIDQYCVVSLVGAGGMGVVYRGRDLRLGRDVALKFLPGEFLADRQYVLRAEREARTLASLNHPNIAAIYDLKQTEDMLCLVLEYVAGETLAERISRGPVRPAEALEIGRQIAEALETAHAKGIIHRDVKPANIKITPEGRVKVLDFGLAKMSTNVWSESIEAATRITQDATILGTPAYMSPEQLRGYDADHRADVWAFGCVLYESLAARRAFPGETVPDTIASVLKTEPDWMALPEQTPLLVQDLIRRCLRKDPGDRPQQIGEAREQLAAAAASPNAARADDVAPAIQSLAVLPFVNGGGNPETEYLSDGLTESLIFSLYQLPQLRVMSRSAVFRFKGSTDDAQQIGQRLGVRAVLTGRVLQRGDRLIITAELVDVDNGWQIWGEQYRRSAAEIFTIEDDIAREISSKLRLKFAPDKTQRPIKRYTENVEAYHLYLKGKYFWGKRTQEGLHTAIRFFREAIERDPTYALAYAGLAEGYVPLGFYCHISPQDAYSKAGAAARKALQIDPDLWEARTVLAAVSKFKWDWAAAETQLREIIKLEPKYPRARQALAELLMTRGAADEAILQVRQALELDALSLHMNAALTMMLHFGRKYEEAIEQGRRTVDLDANFFPGRFYLGLALSAHGQHSEAAAEMEKAVALSGASTLMLSALAAVFAFAKKEDESRRILAELRELGRRKYVSQVFIAAVHSGLNDMDRALDCLDQAYEDRCAWLGLALTADPRLDVLRGEPRFHHLRRRIGL